MWGQVSVSRRQVVKGGAVSALAAGGALLAGCGGGSDDGVGDGPETTDGAGPIGDGTTASASGSASGPGSSAASGGLQLPTYVSYAGVTPDLPGLPNGTSAYFAKYPANPAQFSPSPPGDGKSVTTLTMVNTSVKPLGGNRHWQAVNKMLGVDFKLNGVPATGYVDKFQTTVAGDSLPDLAVILPTLMHDLPGLLKARFEDLTDHLSGDNVKKYPGLANIPSYCWRATVFNKGIYMIPIHRFALLRGYLIRSDLAKAVGVDPNPKSGDDLLAIAKAFSNPSKKKYLCVAPTGLLDLVNEMMGTPNQWAVADGKFTKDYEADSFPQALDVVRQAWKDQQIHPDGFGANVGQLENSSFYAGNTIGRWATSSWAGYAVNALETSPQATTVAFTVPTWDGGGAAKRWLTDGAPYMVGLKKNSPDRIAQLLDVINVLAAPFGTQEYLLMKYGVKDVDYTVDADGSPTLNATGKAENMQPIAYCGSPALVHFGGANPDYGQAEYEYEKAAMDNPAPLPTVGLQSETDLKQGAVLAKKMTDLQSDIMQGRKPVSAWADGVKSWKSSGGDTIRAEYEKAYAAANS
jgi:putative aldouronate transport system substrate-binding protein